MLLAHVPRRVFRAGERMVLPFDIQDAARSIHILFESPEWPECSQLFGAELQLWDGRRWTRGGGFTTCGGQQKTPYAQIGLYPRKTPHARVVLRAKHDVRSSVVVHNSITVGTHGTVVAAADNANVAVDAGSGSNRCLFAFLLRSNRVIDTFTYNSIALTVVGEAAGASSDRATIGKQVAPATGSHTLHAHLIGGADFSLTRVPMDGADTSMAIETAISLLFYSI